MTRQPNILTRSVASVGLSVHLKLLIAFLAVTCMLVVLALFGLFTLQQSNARTEALIRDQKRIEFFYQIHTDVGTLATMAVGQYTPYAVDAEGAGSFFVVPIADRFDDLRIFVGRGVRQFGQPGMPDAELIAQLRSRINTLDVHAKETQRLRLDVGKPAAAPYAMENLFEPLRGIQSTMYTVIQDIEKDMAARARSTAIEYQSSRRLVIASALVSVCFALLLGYSISSSLLLPVRRIGQTLADVAQGNFGRLYI